MYIIGFFPPVDHNVDKPYICAVYNVFVSFDNCIHSKYFDLFINKQSVDLLLSPIYLFLIINTRSNVKFLI